MTQLETTRNFIRSVGTIDNYLLQKWGLNQGWQGDSASRHARTLKELGEVYHPDKDNGKEDTHMWIWGSKSTYTFDSDNQGILIGEGI